MTLRLTFTRMFEQAQGITESTAFFSLVLDKYIYSGSNHLRKSDRKQYVLLAAGAVDLKKHSLLQQKFSAKLREYSKYNERF